MMTVWLVGVSFSIFVLALMVAYYKKSQIKISVLSREKVNEKEFFTLRIESDDFLFLKKEQEVLFLESLDKVDDYKIVNMEKMHKAAESKQTESTDKLVLNRSKKVS